MFCQGSFDLLNKLEMETFDIDLLDDKVCIKYKRVFLGFSKLIFNLNKLFECQKRYILNLKKYIKNLNIFYHFRRFSSIFKHFHTFTDFLSKQYCLYGQVSLGVWILNTIWYTLWPIPKFCTYLCDLT